jgi:hypothetical protein
MRCVLWVPGQAVNTTSFVLQGGGRHMPLTDPAMVSPIPEGIPSFFTPLFDKNFKVLAD